MTNFRSGQQKLNPGALNNCRKAKTIDKSPNSSIESPARHNESLSEVRASLRASAPGLFRIRSRSCIPAAFGIENGLLHPRLDNIGATLKHHEAILHSHTFVIAGIGRFRARGVDSCPRHQLLGRRGLQIREYRATTTLRTLRRRSQANPVRQ